jgi:hypothetical protein
MNKGPGHSPRQCPKRYCCLRFYLHYELRNRKGKNLHAARTENENIKRQDRWRSSVIRAARRCCYVKSNLTVVDDASAAAALNFLVAADFLAVALRFLVCAAFLPADLSFLVRVAFFAAEIRFVGMGNPLMT